MPKKTFEFMVNGRQFFFRRTVFKNFPKGQQSRIVVTEKGRRGFVSHFKQQGRKINSAENRNLAREKTEQKTVKKIIGGKPVEEEKRGIFRSAMVASYNGDTHAEYRIWVHTEEQTMSETELQEKLRELFKLFPTNINSFDEETRELNAEIDEDEAVPEKKFGTFFGYVRFDTDGQVKEYYAENGQEVPPFAVPS